LESALLLLEKDTNNQQVIEEIFRIMHSLKGSGGMFGFDLLSEVTHVLESLYEIFRSKKHPIDSEVISFTLNSIDGLHLLMVQEPKKEDIARSEKMKLDTQAQISRFPTGEQNHEAEEKPVASATDNLLTKQITYFITFVPNENVLVNGTNPIYLIDELNALGECNILVSFDQMPELEEMDPSKCYCSWSIFIATTESVDTLMDVFIFVADNAEINIEKVQSGNIIHNEKIMAGFLNAKQNGEEWIPAEPETSLTETPAQPVEEPEKEEPPVLLIQEKEDSKNSAFSQTTVDSIKVDSKKIDYYMNLISELITAQYHLEEISSNLKNKELEHVTEIFGKLGRQLRENAFDMSLIPIQSVVLRFNRLIHDLSKSLNKEVVLVTEGMETELDKNIIEKLLEPLLHIVRNSMDHGIESREERLRKQKNPAGKVSIKASTVGSNVQIEIEDDGAGLDVNQIREKVISKGLATDLSNVSDDEIYQYIFEPGFSTSSLVTDVSGRGVGMDVVRRRVQEMRGVIEITTEKDKFTRFTIKLPLSLSIIDGLLTTVGESYYVIPSSVIRKIYHVKSSLLKKGFRQVLNLEGNQLPYLNMHEEFEHKEQLPKQQFVISIAFENQLFGLVVDGVVREYQAVIKPLGRLLKGQDVFSGASILGTGQLALVVDTNKMIKKYT